MNTFTHNLLLQATADHLVLVKSSVWFIFKKKKTYTGLKEISRNTLRINYKEAKVTKPSRLTGILRWHWQSIKSPKARDRSGSIGHLPINTAIPSAVPSNRSFPAQQGSLAALQGRCVCSMWGAVQKQEWKFVNRSLGWIPRSHVR